VRPCLSLAGIIAASLLARPGGSGIVSIQVPYEQLERKGRAVSLAASFASHSGNGPGFTAGGGFLGAATAGGGRHLVLLRAAGDYAEFEETVTASSSLGHLRHQYSFLPWLSSDAFLQAQQDRYQRLAVRRLAGGGPAFTLPGSKRVKFRAGTGAMFEMERYRIDSTSGEPEKSQGWRSTSYLSLTVALGAGASFGTVCYFQPALRDFGDVRLLNETSLSAPLNSWLSLGFSSVVAHDSSPPARVKRTDVDVRQTLGVRL
jgi:hypothetical protein